MHDQPVAVSSRLSACTASLLIPSDCVDGSYTKIETALREIAHSLGLLVIGPNSLLLTVTHVGNLQFKIIIYYSLR